MSAAVSAGRSAVVAAVVEPALTRPALVFGGLPPAARDLDLLVDPADREPVVAALTAAGFDGAGMSYVRVRAEGGSVRADGADVTGPGDWDVPADELAWLLSSALPLPGSARLVRPSPAAALLLLARRLGPERRALPERHRERVRAALAEDPLALDVAGRHARAWRCEAALAVLVVLARTGRPPSPADRYRLARERQVRERETGRLLGLRALRRALLPARRRGPLLAVCGLDAAERARQVALLLVVLADLGVPAVAVDGPAVGVRAVLRRRRDVRRATRRGAVLADGWAVDAALAGRVPGAALRLLPRADLTLVLDVPDGGPLPTAYRRAGAQEGAVLVAPHRPGQRGLVLARHVCARLA